MTKSDALDTLAQLVTAAQECGSKRMRYESSAYGYSRERDDWLRAQKRMDELRAQLENELHPADETDPPLVEMKIVVWPPGTSGRYTAIAITNDGAACYGVGYGGHAAESPAAAIRGLIGNIVPVEHAASDPRGGLCRYCQGVGCGGCHGF